jgi:hypothetical protein
MKYVLFGSLMGCLLLGCVMSRNAGEVAEHDDLNMTLEIGLVDGSRIVGAPKFQAIPLETYYARALIPLAKIKSIQMNKDHVTASLLLRDGEKQEGIIGLDQIKLETIFGTIQIGREHVQKIEIRMCSGLAQKGLLLWNCLDSENDVANSRVGPGGKLNAGRFVMGRFGKGIELNMQEQFGVSFPVEIVPGPDGCIEFWAKLVNFPKQIRQPGGTWPGLIAVCNQSGAQDFFLAFCVNDGAANGGICSRIAGLGSAGTGSFGSWTYARALNANDSEGWHHYALVWASNGIPDVDNGKRITAIFVDGKLNTGHWQDSVGNTLAIPKDGRFGLLSHQGTTTGSVIFDNLKIWNYAKTDFSDRDAE